MTKGYTPVPANTLTSAAKKWSVEPTRVTIVANEFERLFGPYLREHAPMLDMEYGNTMLKVWEPKASDVGMGQVMSALESICDMDVDFDTYKAHKNAHRDFVYDVTGTRKEEALVTRSR